MPEIKLPEVKLPGLREMRTDDIKHALSEVPRPDIKLSDLDPRGIELPRLEFPRIDLAAAANSVAATAAERNPLRRKRRSRAPMVIAGLIIAGLGALAVMNLGWLRTRIAEFAERARTRMDAGRVSDSLEPIQLEAGQYTGTIGIPIQADTYADTLPPVETATVDTTALDTGYAGTNGGFDSGSTDATTDGLTSEPSTEGEIRSIS